MVLAVTSGDGKITVYVIMTYDKSIYYYTSITFHMWLLQCFIYKTLKINIKSFTDTYNASVTTPVKFLQVEARQPAMHAGVEAEIWG